MKKVRTSLAIDSDLRQAAHALARRRGVSLSRLVSEAIEAHIENASDARPLSAREKRFPRSDVFERRTGRSTLSIDHERIAFRP